MDTLKTTTGGDKEEWSADTYEEIETDAAGGIEAVRKEYEGVIKGGESEKESEKLTAALSRYEKEYASIPDNIKSRCSWNDISERLLANDSEKLRLADAMQGGGQLIGIDKKGKALFRDKGVEPVMFGFDQDDNLIQIYDRNPEEMGTVKKWANYFECRTQLKKDGYEMFSNDGEFDFSEEMKQSEDYTEEPFVASENRRDYRASWLESGDKPGRAHGVLFDSVFGSVGVCNVNPENRDDGYGVVRLLRV